MDSSGMNSCITFANLRKSVDDAIDAIERIVQHSDGGGVYINSLGNRLMYDKLRALQQSIELGKTDVDTFKESVKVLLGAGDVLLEVFQAFLDPKNEDQVIHHGWKLVFNYIFGFMQEVVTSNPEHKETPEYEVVNNKIQVLYDQIEDKFPHAKADTARSATLWVNSGSLHLPHFTSRISPPRLLLRDDELWLDADHVGEHGVVHAVVLQLLPALLPGHADGKATLGGLHGQPVGGEQAVQGEGVVTQHLPSVEQIDCLDDPCCDTLWLDVECDLDVGYVELDTVERTQHLRVIEHLEEGVDLLVVPHPVVFVLGEVVAVPDAPGGVVHRGDGDWVPPGVEAHRLDVER
eukprot:753470-Hanusia_phi.AAC.2